MLAQLVHQVSKLVALQVRENAGEHLVDLLSLMPPDWVWQPEPKEEPQADPHAVAQAMASSKCQQLSTPVQSITVEMST